jgi:putative transposase
VACDFFTKCVLTPLGQRTAYCLVFMHLATRRVFVCRSTIHPNEQWMCQQARNVLMWLDDNAIEAKFFLHDRDTKFTPKFDRLFRQAGARIIRTPVQAPNANAFVESWIGKCKNECLEHFLCFGQRHLDFILQQYAVYFNRHRPHQGLANRTLPAVEEDPQQARAPDEGAPVQGAKCLGGLLRHHYRAAA